MFRRVFPFPLFRNLSAIYIEFSNLYTARKAALLGLDSSVKDVSRCSRDVYSARRRSCDSASRVARARARVQWTRVRGAVSLSFSRAGEMQTPVSSASCKRDFTRRVARMCARAFAHSCDCHSYSERGINTHTRGTRNEPVNFPLSFPADRHSFVATRGAFIYLRNTPRDSIWYMHARIASCSSVCLSILFAIPFPRARLFPFLFLFFFFFFCF